MSRVVVPENPDPEEFVGKHVRILGWLQIALAIAAYGAWEVWRAKMGFLIDRLHERGEHGLGLVKALARLAPVETFIVSIPKSQCPPP